MKNKTILCIHCKHLIEDPYSYYCPLYKECNFTDPICESTLAEHPFYEDSDFIKHQKYMKTKIRPTTTPFNVYHIDKQYLEFMSEKNTSGIRCYPDFNLYCGPVLTVYDDIHDCNINFFIPVTEPDIEIPNNCEHETWLSQLIMSEDGLTSGYDFATMMPCLSKHLTIAETLNKDEQKRYDYFVEHQNNLNSLARSVYINT